MYYFRPHEIQLISVFCLLSIWNYRNANDTFFNWKIHSFSSPNTKKKLFHILHRGAHKTMKSLFIFVWWRIRVGKENSIQNGNALGMAAAHALFAQEILVLHNVWWGLQAFRWWIRVLVNMIHFESGRPLNTLDTLNGHRMSYLQWSRYCNGFDGCHWRHSHCGRMR